MEPAHAHNLLYVTRYDFRQATKVFARKRLALGPVLMAFENGFLSFESGGVAGVMHAEGDWQGRATFSPEILRADSDPDSDPHPHSDSNRRKQRLCGRGRGRTHR